MLFLMNYNFYLFKFKWVFSSLDDTPHCEEKVSDHPNLYFRNHASNNKMSLYKRCRGFYVLKFI